MRKYSFLLMCLVFLVSLFSVASSSVEAGKLKPPSERFTPGEWFLGETPPNLDPNKPPIVFVQGKNGAANSWYGETTYYGPNDMYDSAYENGYQTVFVQLYDAAGNGSHSQWDNGQLLADMLQEIYQHFGKKVNVVAHSKGGPDTQAALVHYGAHRYVGNVITLGSPHHGSHLADLSYSWWAGWLASLLGQRDDGTYSLQVGEMAKFREDTDSHPNIGANNYYTVAGSSWGPSLSALWTGGMYLSSHGDNDGLVNVWSTQLPYGTHLFTDSSLDHDNIRMGSKVFLRIEPYLRTASTNNMKKGGEAEKKEIIESASNQVLLGGPLTQNKQVDHTFSVDSTTDGVISILTASQQVDVQFVSPTGKTYHLNNSQVKTGKDNFYFRGAYVQTFEFPKMEAGTWTVQLTSRADKDAFFFVGNWKNSSSVSLQLPGKIKEKNLDLKKDIIRIVKSEKQIPSPSFDIRIVDSNGKLVFQSNSMKKSGVNQFASELPKVKQSGVYNITVDMKGQTANGTPFQRTMVQSVYIEK